MSIHPSRTRCSGDLSPRRCFLAIRRWLPPPNITAAGSHLLWFCLLASTTRRCPPPPADALRDDDPRAHSLRWRSDNTLVSGLHESVSAPHLSFSSLYDLASCRCLGPRTESVRIHGEKSNPDYGAIQVVHIYGLKSHNVLCPILFSDI
jgi:hypothetical protein